LTGSAETQDHLPGPAFLEACRAVRLAGLDRNRGGGQGSRERAPVIGGVAHRPQGEVLVDGDHVVNEGGEVHVAEG